MDAPIVSEKVAFTPSSHSGSSIDVSVSGLGSPYYSQSRTPASYLNPPSPYFASRRPPKAFRYDSLMPLFAGDWSVNNLVASGSFNEEPRNSIIIAEAQAQPSAQKPHADQHHQQSQQRHGSTSTLGTTGSTGSTSTSASTPTITNSGTNSAGNTASSSNLVASHLAPVAEASVTLPQTKIVWEASGSTKLSSSGDSLRSWQFQNGQLHAIASYAKRSKSQPHLVPAPLTSFDWNLYNQNKVITSSIDTTCTLWDLATQTVTTQLIAHDQEVNDVAFLAGSQNNFVSVGADGSARLFDSRSSDNSTIIYEAPPDEQTKAVVPMSRIAPSLTNEHIVCAFGQEQKTAIILDTRATRNPITQSKGHQAPVNAIKWIPYAHNSLATGGDDCQLLVWDVSRGTFIGCHNEPQQINNVSASKDGKWLAAISGKSVQAVSMQFS